MGDRYSATINKTNCLIGFGQPSLRKSDGQVGAKCSVNINNPDGSDGYYEFGTHGMSVRSVADRIEAIRTFHDKRADRLNSFRAMQQEAIVVRGDEYRVTDLTIGYSTDATRGYLFVNVRRKGSRATLRGFPIRIPFADIDSLPDDASILAMIDETIPDEAALLATHEGYVSSVSAALT